MHLSDVVFTSFGTVTKKTLYLLRILRLYCRQVNGHVVVIEKSSM